MNAQSLKIVSVGIAAALPLACHARTWTDASGRYTVEADLAGYTDDSVLLLREDQHLGEIDLDQLSEKDREFVASQEAKSSTERLSAQKQTWTTKGGVKIVGRVVDYVSKQVALERRRGKLYVNDRVFDNLPEVYQTIVPKVVAHFEQNQVSDKKSLEAWLVHNRAKPAVYQVDGVVMELASGDEYAVPFFLLSDDDLSLLQPGWDVWVNASDDRNARDDAATKLQTMAAAYQQNQQANRQIAQLQFAVQAANAGVTSLWEVTLYPGAGAAGPPLWVVSAGRDSRAASATALAQHPGYTVGPVRRVSN